MRLAALKSPADQLRLNLGSCNRLPECGWRFSANSKRADPGCPGPGPIPARGLDRVAGRWPRIAAPPNRLQRWRFLRSHQPGPIATTGWLGAGVPAGASRPVIRQHHGHGPRPFHPWGALGNQGWPKSSPTPCPMASGRGTASVWWVLDSASPGSPGCLVCWRLVGDARAGEAHNSLERQIFQNLHSSPGQFRPLQDPGRTPIC